MKTPLIILFWERKTPITLNLQIFQENIIDRLPLHTVCYASYGLVKSQFTWATIKLFKWPSWKDLDPGPWDKHQSWSQTMFWVVFHVSNSSDKFISQNNPTSPRFLPIMGFGAPRSKLYMKTLLFPCNVTKQNFILIMIMCKGKLQTYLGMCGYVTICVRKYVFRLDTVCCVVGDFIFALVGTSHFYPNLVSLLKNIP